MQYLLTLSSKLVGIVCIFIANWARCARTTHIYFSLVNLNSFEIMALLARVDLLDEDSSTNIM